MPPAVRQFAPERFAFRFAESFVLTATLAILVACVFASYLFPARVDVAAFLPRLLLVAGTFMAGLVYRLTGRSERLASGLIATALMLAFSLALATYNHIILPPAGPLIDPVLFRFGELIGYSWPELVGWGARHATMSAALAAVYQSSLPQLAILLVLLALAGRPMELDRMLMTLVIAATATVFIWSLFPSVGPSAFEALPQDVEKAASVVLGSAEGERLRSFMAHGPDRIAPDTMTGLIGFPSFHTVLALLCIRFAWSLSALRWPFLAINLAMLPATLLHGAHHAADLLGGAAVFLLALRATEYLIRLDASGRWGERAPASARTEEPLRLGTSSSSAR